MAHDTIYALATAPAPAALAVLRLSGPESPEIIARLCGGPVPPDRRLRLRKLRHPQTAEILDEALIAGFPAGGSYTSEAMAEVHVHGGRAVSDDVAAALELLGARLARPGEFTRRAVLAGRLDLAQAEAVSALIAAETETVRRQAMRVLEGAVGHAVRQWRSSLTEAAGLLETSIDFVDQDLGPGIEDQAAAALRAIAEELRIHEASAVDFEASARRKRVVLIGPPNAGKSSLLNAAFGQDRVIVSAQPGTTRDVVSATYRARGAELDLIDTAGLRTTSDKVEAEGVRRAAAVAEKADHRILVLSADTLAVAAPALALAQPEDTLIWTKRDLAPTPPDTVLSRPFGAVHRVSVHDGSAETALRQRLDTLSAASPQAISPIAGSDRRRAVLRSGLSAVEDSLEALRCGRVELASASVWDAIARLEGLIGGVDKDEALDSVFARFCIGK